MDFITDLPILTDWKGDSYNLILDIVDRLTKMVYYNPVKVTINAPGLAGIIINVIVRYYGLSDSIVTDRASLFTLKFWSSLCYFLGIKQKLSTAFHLQTDGQTKRQNSTIEAYLWAFVNFEQYDWAQLLPMAKFTYNNAKNASTGFTPFELNYRYHPWISYKEDFDLRSKSKTVEKLSSKLRELMTVCQQNLHHAQELQKRGHDKEVKPRSYTPREKVWLSSKYFKTKQNHKLEAKFLGLFWVLHPIGKQAYKLKLPKKWRIHDIFHVLLLEQNTTKKKQMNNIQQEFEAGNNKEYEVDGIRDSAIYTRESAGQLPRLYHLVSWKSYPKKENTWELALVIRHLWKLVIAYHKDNPERPTATSAPVDMAPPMARPSVLPRLTAKPTTDILIKRKQGWLAGSTTTTKQAKKS